MFHKLTMSRIMLRRTPFSSVTDIAANHIPLTSNCLRLRLTLDAAIRAFRYPDQGQHLSQLGDLTGYWCVKDLHTKMMADEVGRRILQDKPRVNEQTFNLPELLELPPNTFGHAYAKFMTEKHFSSEERPLVQYIPDPELAYVYQRYKEIHDFIHILLMQDVSLHDELVVKWYEMAQLGLPSATLSASVGMLKLSYGEMRDLLKNLDKILKSAHQGRLIMNVYFEEEKTTDLIALRKKLGIIAVL